MADNESAKRDSTAQIARDIREQGERDGRPVSIRESERKAMEARQYVENRARDGAPRPTPSAPPSTIEVRGVKIPVRSLSERGDAGARLREAGFDPDDGKGR